MQSIARMANPKTPPRTKTRTKTRTRTKVVAEGILWQLLVMEAAVVKLEVGYLVR
jgi:hypothetical protein